MRMLCGGWLLLVLVIGACGPGADPTPELIAVAMMPTATASPLPTDTETPPPSATPTPRPTRTHTPWPTVTPTATATPERAVVVIVQPVPAGYAIPPEAVALTTWPAQAAPFHGYTSPDDVINMVALVDLMCFEPVLAGAIAPREVGSGFLELPGSCPSLPEATGATVDVVIAVEAIARDQMITPGMVALRGWPAHLVPPDALHALGDVIGAYTRTGILREQPVLASRLND
ncbi:MAG: SAF domain-containing protein [Chloroflexota bacterium]